MPKSKPKKRYNSLSEFRDHLQATTSEVIIAFTGLELLTQSTRYWMIDGTIYSEPRGRQQ